MCYMYSYVVRYTSFYLFFFFFNDTATTEIYTLSLHDALPISRDSTSSLLGNRWCSTYGSRIGTARATPSRRSATGSNGRSEEHTSELQSRQYLVCRLLLEKKKKKINQTINKQTT